MGCGRAHRLHLCYSVKVGGANGTGARLRAIAWEHLQTQADRRSESTGKCDYSRGCRLFLDRHESVLHPFEYQHGRA